ncbi:MAG TPA: hypothetical protein VGF62_10955, partial [Rhizomicrobium sp.]
GFLHFTSMACNRFADARLREDFELVAVTRDKDLRALLRKVNAVPGHKPLSLCSKTSLPWLSHR